MTKSPASWLPRNRDQLCAQCSLSSMGLLSFLKWQKQKPFLSCAMIRLRHTTQPVSACWQQTHMHRTPTSSSAMAERPRELDQRFQVGGSIWGYYRLKGYFSRHGDMTQFTLTGTHHMVNTPFLLLGLAAEYRSRQWCDKHCGRPSDVYNTDRRTKLTAVNTISRWLLLKKRKNRSLSHPLEDLGVTYALHL